MALKTQMRISLSMNHQNTDVICHLTIASGEGKQYQHRRNDTPDNAEDSDHPVELVLEQDEWEEGQVNPDEPLGNEDSEDSNYLLVSEEDVSLGKEDVIVPEESIEQEHFKRQLIATMRSLKKKQQQFQAEQDMLICLQRIYNFLLFHAIILSILDVLYFTSNFISFFGTNLLT